MSAHPFGRAGATAADVRRLAGIVSATLGSFPEIKGDDLYGAMRARGTAERAAAARLTEEEGARWRDRGSEMWVTMGGIRAASTQGVTGVLRNWLTSARKKIGEAS